MAITVNQLRRIIREEISKEKLKKVFATDMSEYAPDGPPPRLSDTGGRSWAEIPTEADVERFIKFLGPDLSPEEKEELRNRPDIVADMESFKMFRGGHR